MLSTVSNVWWSRLHLEMVRTAKTCSQLQTAGKNIKSILKQNQRGELPECTEANQVVKLIKL